MKIQIEIPKEFEEDFNYDKFEGCFTRFIIDSRHNAVLTGNYERETLAMLVDAFANAEVE